MPEDALQFDEIHAVYRPRILRYLTRMVGDLEAEDLTQEVMIRINRALPGFRGESSLSTWIYRIATNAALDRLRDPSHKYLVPHGPADGSDEDGREVTVIDVGVRTVAPSPEQQASLKERYDCYCDFIGDLPANYRMVVALAELQDLAASEIADVLGLSLDVVKIRLHRGRAKLIKALKEHCRPEDWL